MSRPKKAPAAEEEAPPPPYVETDGPSSEARPSTSSAPPLTEFPMPVAPASLPFPAAFTMYFRGESGRRYLGEDASDPLYAVSFRSSGAVPHVVLHNGPDWEAPPLAMADPPSTFHRASTITLPALPNFGRNTTEEPLERSSGFTHRTTYLFSIEVETGDPAAGGGAGGALRREGFEWRVSKGDEVKEVDRGCYPEYGWKLVRLHGEAEGIGGTRAVRDAGTTSDGKEIVAVLATYSGWCRIEVAKFRFLGTGATGHLGPRFSIMAVITALHIYNLRIEKAVASANGSRSTNTSSSSAAVDASNAAALRASGVNV